MKIYYEMNNDAVITIATVIAQNLPIPCFDKQEFAEFKAACMKPYDVPKLRCFLQKLHDFAIERTKHVNENNMMEETRV